MTRTVWLSFYWDTV